jgi:hypothetical protein
MAGRTAYQKLNINMRVLIMLATAAIGFLAGGAPAQSLQLQTVNYPGIYCRFDPSCSVASANQSDTYAPSNMLVSCVLESRSFPGNSMDSQGQYGYEYRLTLNNNGAMGTNAIMVDTLTLKFGDPVPFAFGMHASNQVWLVTSGGPVGLEPSSADESGKQIKVHFSPPLTLQTQTDQTTNTCYFGLVSYNPPRVTRATVSGSLQFPDNSTTPFDTLLNAQTP